MTRCTYIARSLAHESTVEDLLNHERMIRSRSQYSKRLSATVEQEGASGQESIEN
ncbi:hypothetical protein KIN20_011121 [Parelaphostrongylus tenuis]|uniref:Uncharacterized protein n=1 Tax=Parelaphostrongylus tenuis TaxID=148309 RepID=A0AAD5MT35_PARTN|nr:hypothetical protein KIN20_011121 [Parelaphostrongylus tenuis]